MPTTTNPTPSQRYAQLIASGLSHDDALSQMVAPVEAQVPTQRESVSDAPANWNSSAGDIHHADRVTQDLNRADFELKCAQRNPPIPPEVYNNWTEAWECDRFSAEDSRKANHESGLVQAGFNIDCMIDNHWQPLRTYSEYATSGFSLEIERPIRDALVAAIAARRGNRKPLVVLWRRHDRVTRRTKDAVALYQLLLETRDQMNVDIKFSGAKDAPDCHFCEAFLSYHLREFIKGEESSQVSRDRILDHHEPKAANGVVLTGAYARAFGYTVDHDKNVRLVTTESSWMEEAITRIVGGESPYPVWRDLTARGMVGRPTKKRKDGTLIPGRRIVFSSWLRMLASPRWCGHRYFKVEREKRDDPKYQGILIPVNIPSVCTRDVWESELLPKLNQGKGKRGGESRIEHALSGFGRCTCNSHLVVDGDYYVCAAKMRSYADPDLAASLEGKAHVTVPKAVFEATAEAVMFYALSTVSLAEVGAAQTASHEISSAETTRSQIHADLAEIDKKLKRLEIKIDSGFYDDKPKAAKQDKQTLQNARHEEAAKLAAIQVAEQPIERLSVEEVRRLWVEASPRAKREVFGKVFKTIEIAACRRGTQVRHEERMTFNFASNYEAPADELAALLSKRADERIASQKRARQQDGEPEFKTHAVELYESGNLTNQQIADRLITRFEVSPRGCPITSTLVWDVLHRYYAARGMTYTPHKVVRHLVTVEAQQRLYQLRSGGHLWREVADLIERATTTNPALRHPKGPWTSQSARTAFYSYVQFGGAKPLDDGRYRLGRISDDLLARLNLMQAQGMTYQEMADFVTARGYISMRGNTVCNPGTIYTQLRAYRSSIAAL